MGQTVLIMKVKGYSCRRFYVWVIIKIHDALPRLLKILHQVRKACFSATVKIYLLLYLYGTE